ncbi:NfeD family protein [Sinanaerobacter chloroacetimidivorans]|jgi:membrane protein implicated in regulation of membrane protease activity|uniref:NfeD family protein n=1 Tax=Sinanaerobacter chloroacetimidivorans TaxID=2818044 RepID=A0A8J7VXZ8_9FIRM|nr:NfeD family protein [Sinanaerobacter chloroacetimidivorans]MBR0596766.1 NfeD family protein [Sinanaerobacter chloroacetimidivorans]
MIPGFEMSEPLIWILIAVIFAIIEGFTMGLTTIWFTVGGVAACFIALIGGPLLLQGAVFLAVSIILLYFTRPLAEKRLKIGHEKNNIDQMIGKIALVTEDIMPYGTGQAKLNGQIWTAASLDNQTLLKGQEVKVVKIEGVKLIVELVKGEETC